jgi:hypothetical protein
MLQERNFNVQARKLSTPGTTIHVVAFGGSVTAGKLSASPEGSWVEHTASWLRSAFPQIRFEVLNLARNASNVAAAAQCWYQYMPANTDLVLIEYWWVRLPLQHRWLNAVRTLTADIKDTLPPDSTAAGGLPWANAAGSRYWCPSMHDVTTTKLMRRMPALHLQRQQLQLLQLWQDHFPIGESCRSAARYCFLEGCCGSPQCSTPVVEKSSL